MKKFLVYVVIISLSMVVAGLYGILHDQISYTVSPEYFTKFKFQQFGLTEIPLPERVRASIVGLLASWWMGIPIGLLVGGAGFMHQGHRQMFRVTLWAMVVTVGFTFLYGLGGLAYGWFQTKKIDMAQYDGWYIPKNVTNLRRFLCVGYMHNASYMGGCLAIFVACAFHIIVKIRTY